MPAHFDFDGRMDLAVWRPSNGAWYILTSGTAYNKAVAIVRQWGLSTDRPMPADYDGDGRSDIAVYRPSTGVWTILRSWLDYSKALPFAVQWGVDASGDVPLPAEYDGDGAADPAVWRPAAGLWYMLQSSNNLSTYRVQQWALARKVIFPLRRITAETASPP